MVENLFILIAAAAIRCAQLPDRMEVKKGVEIVEEAAYSAPMPTDHLAHLVMCCEKYQVPVELALALIERESGFQPGAVSDTNDHGYMQINACNFAAARDWYGLEPATVPMDNIEYGIILLAEAFQQYGSWDKALMIYAGGPSVVGSPQWEQGYTAKTRALLDRAQEIRANGGID